MKPRLILLLGLAACLVVSCGRSGARPTSPPVLVLLPTATAPGGGALVMMDTPTPDLASAATSAPAPTATTVVLIVTATPTPTGTPALAAPTDTPAPPPPTARATTPTPAPPTATPAPPPTNTPVPVPTPTPTPRGYAKPVIVWPLAADGKQFPADYKMPDCRGVMHGKVQWKWDGTLGENEFFDVQVWRANDVPTGAGWAGEDGPKRRDLWELEVNVVNAVDAGFKWRVAVMKGDLATRQPLQYLSPWSDEGSFGCCSPTYRDVGC